MEPELHLAEHVLVPDLAGWRRERLPAVPTTTFFELTPDWVCEVISSSSARTDRGAKSLIYAKHGVRHLWFVDRSSMPPVVTDASPASSRVAATH
jgi:Uma2 family endonuclease